MNVKPPHPSECTPDLVIDTNESTPDLVFDVGNIALGHSVYFQWIIYGNSILPCLLIMILEYRVLRCIQ